MKPKLWSFGCSHAAGDELGLSMSYEEVELWVKNITGYNTISESLHKLGDNRYYKLVMLPWLQKINYQYNPKLSFAGLLADLLNIELTNYAVSGNSIDNMFEQFLLVEKNINWDKDIVIFSPTSVNRWVNTKGTRVNTDIIMDKKKCYFDFAPRFESQVIYYYSILNYIQTHYNKVKFIKIFNDEINYDLHKKINFINNKSMLKLYKTDKKMPNLHFGEETHKKFAQYIKECIDNDRNNK